MISIIKALIPPDTVIRFYNGNHEDITDLLLSHVFVSVTVKGEEKIISLQEALKPFIGEDCHGA